MSDFLGGGSLSCLAPLLPFPLSLIEAPVNSLLMSFPSIPAANPMLGAYQQATVTQ